VQSWQCDDHDDVSVIIVAMTTIMSVQSSLQ
jgi:hypothetical protein